MAAKQSPKFKLISSKEVLATRVFTVRREKAQEPGGLTIDRDIVHHSGSAVMLARDAKGRILLVRQFRLPARRQLWELPAGRLDQGETPLAAAKRELMEETGYRAKRWRPLTAFYPSPGYCSERMTVFTAEGLTPGPTNFDEDESIETRWFTWEEILRMIRLGRIQDSKTMVAALSLLLRKLQKMSSRAG